MANSDGWLVLAHQEAFRVEEQSKNAWAALKNGGGGDHDQAYQQAIAGANEAFGPVGPDSPPAERLAHASFILEKAIQLQNTLVRHLNLSE